MGKKKRKVIQIYNWQYLIPQIAIFVLLAFIFDFSRVSKPILLSLAIYLLASGYLKVMIPKYHRKGLFYIRKGEWEGAIAVFIKSYTFFSKHSWVDNYRAYTMLSISRLGYREMALMNIIYCYQKLNNTAEIKNYHRRLAEEYPENPYVQAKK